MPHESHPLKNNFSKLKLTKEDSMHCPVLVVVRGSTMVANHPSATAKANRNKSHRVPSPATAH